MLPMKFHKSGLLAIVAVAMTAMGLAAADSPTTLVGLSGNNTLVLFGSSNPGKISSIKVSGVSGTLLGIDLRPANGQLYGVSDTHDLYTIDPTTGIATHASTLSVAFKGGPRSGMDFNPQADRLRLNGANAQNLRINVDLGATATDGALTYASRDRNAGKSPSVSATAYTNSIAGTDSTKTFDIDSNLDVLVLQEPPNEGVLVTVGSLGVDFEPLSGFDIVTNRGINTAFAASGSTLYTINLSTGAATKLGTIGNNKVNILSLSAVNLAGPMGSQ